MCRLEIQWPVVDVLSVRSICVICGSTLCDSRTKLSKLSTVSRGRSARVSSTEINALTDKNVCPTVDGEVKYSFVSTFTLSDWKRTIAELLRSRRWSLVE